VNSKVFRGEVLHHRLAPVSHRFRYPAYTYALDVDELSRLDRCLSWFGYNRAGLVSIHSKDYLDGTEGELRAKLQDFLALHGPHPRYERIWLVTGARFLGYVFNPVSFWLCCRADEQLACVVAEVNNTFGERHLYVLDQPLDCASQFAVRYRVPKAFYVSPFNPVEGDYEFRLADLRRHLDIRLRVFIQGRPVFNSWVRGRPEPLSDSFWTTLKAYPLTAWLTVPRIHWQAARLYFRKHLPLVSKPRPEHEWTIRAEPPSPLHRAAMTLLRRFLDRAQRGHLRIDLPNRQVWSVGSATEEPCEIRVLNWDFFLRLVWDGDVALGDGWVAGEWESSNLTAVVRFLIENREDLDDRKLWLSRGVARLWGRIRQSLRRNSLKGSRRNIQAHYDLGNELYRRFLDNTMSYSCACFSEPGQDLEGAQRAKIDRLLRKARLHGECHLLEIGCGWGSLALEAVRQTGCRVTGITLSRQQLEWARQRVKEAGLQDRIELKLCDYREITGRFDRILSCEMLEAVGHEHYPAFFASLERLLKPDGLVVLQVITVPDFSYEEYRKSQDWIQKEIFPGALCPSLTALLQAASRNSQLILEDMQNIGPHYARTLRLWRERFLERWDELLSLGYDEKFRRAWVYYLSYCEAAFATRNLADLQLVLTRPKNPVLLAEDPDWPL